MEEPSERAGTLDKALIDLENGERRVQTRQSFNARTLTYFIAARVPAKSRATKLSSIVDHVCSIAFQDGLPNAPLSKLIDLTTLPNELDQGSIATLVKNLYPTSKIPDAVIVKVVGSLGHGQVKPSFSTQAALLKWLVMVYDVLENQAVLSRLYGVLFNLLDTIAIRCVSLLQQIITNTDSLGNLGLSCVTC